jgi:hypothetical protein
MPSLRPGRWHRSLHTGSRCAARPFECSGPGPPQFLYCFCRGNQPKYLQLAVGQAQPLNVRRGRDERRILGNVAQAGATSSSHPALPRAPTAERPLGAAPGGRPRPELAHAADRSAGAGRSRTRCERVRVGRSARDPDPTGTWAGASATHTIGRGEGHLRRRHRRACSPTEGTRSGRYPPIC